MEKEQFLLDSNSEIVNYYSKILDKKRLQLIVKRIIDILLSITLIVLLSPILLFISISIKLDDAGPICFRQTRVTRYGKEFKIIKFRTMILNAEEIGSQITVDNDPRITKVGKKIRKLRLDELPQLFNILTGDMTFVGTRPEVPKYVNHYTDEMKVTLLVRAGVTSMASIEFKDESLILKGSIDPNTTYLEKILPEKMKINILEIEKFSLKRDLKILYLTVLKVMK
ncbi:sugar transferase [Vagococcus fluvialis]|uniref:sugar transferase n=1 Tax=Vagococcus fluvialis TaxID=2738 RepID=UPI003B220527